LRRQFQKNRGLLIHLKTRTEYIWYLNGIFEGYEGFAVVRTIDKEKGLLELLGTEDQEEDLRELLKHLSQEIDLIVLD